MKDKDKTKEHVLKETTELQQRVEFYQGLVQAAPDAILILHDAKIVFINAAGARLFGETTAGSSSAKRQWSFPSGSATLTLSVRGRAGTDGKTIEFHGVAPDEVVEAVPEEVQAGKNSAILRAEEYLSKLR